ncbi:hypothetical protein Tco_0770483 [Tanacetum coccineum]|uniref:Retrovirus-related Pol polyprotein from transposon TNT 1-94 n=1 Tax=Tanacetum coccineum TaxID=301880 RepID=A0ABQ4ZFB4_9ASTR
MGMYISSQSSCDFTTVTIIGESEDEGTIEEIIQNYYDHEDGETTPRFERTQYSVFKIWNQYNIMEDIKRGPYSKKSPIRRIQLLDTPGEKEQNRIQRIRACTHQRPLRNKDQYAVFKIWNQYNILEDIKRGPYSKKSLICRDLDNSTSNILIPLDSWTSGLLVYKLPLSGHLADYDVLYDKVPIFCDNTSAIVISNNPVLHSRTKHIDIRYHFIRDHILKGDIELYFVPTDLQLADIITKSLAEPSFTRLIAELGMLNIDKEVNAGSIANKSLSETTVQTVDQPKASTDKRSNNKKIPSSSKPKTCKNARQPKSKKPVAETQHAEKSVATANATKSL